MSYGLEDQNFSDSLDNRGPGDFWRDSETIEQRSMSGHETIFCRECGEEIPFVDTDEAFLLPSLLIVRLGGDRNKK